MPPWLWLLIVVLLLASRPIEVRLWRTGRISDRTVTALLLARFPLVVAIGALATGGWTVLTFVLIALAVLVTVPFYKFMLGIVREQEPADHIPHMTLPHAD